MTRKRLAALLGFVLAFGVTVGVYNRSGRTRVGIFARAADRRCRGGCTGFAMLLLSGNQGNPAAQIANPIPSGKAFCVSAYLTAQSGVGDWASSDLRGVVQLGGTLGAANSFPIFRQSNDSSSSITVRLYDSGGANHDAAIASMPINTRQQVTGCYTPAGGVFLFVDGTQQASAAGVFTFTQPPVIRLGDLGAGTYTYGAGIDTVCIAGPTGASTGVPSSDVLNACGQFTPQSTGPCFGCVTPNGAGTTRVYALGDSITQYGSHVFRPYPAKLNALLGVTYDVTNAGLSGDTVSAMKTRYDATARNWGRCIFLGGINNIIRDGATGAATFTTASALLDEMRSDGCKPIVVLPTPARNSTTLGWTAGKQTQYDAYRTSLSGYCTTNSATTTCVDTYGAGPTTGMGDGTSPPQLYSTYDSGDQAHPNQVGEDKLAALVFAGATWP